MKITAADGRLSLACDKCDRKFHPRRMVFAEDKIKRLANERGWWCMVRSDECPECHRKTWADLRAKLDAEKEMSTKYQSKRN